jgi:CheY-like chemotaxis protein
MDAAVLRVVTSNNVDVFRLLGQSPLSRLRVEYAVAADLDELVSRVRAIKPDVVLIDAELAGGSGYDACRKIKDDPETAACHVVILLSAPPRGRPAGAPPHLPRLSRADIDHLYESGADDMLALPIHPDDFYHHLAHLAGLPFRRDRRVRIDLELTFTSPSMDGAANTPPLVTQVTNAGSGGLGVLSNHPLPQGEVALARLRQGDTLSPETKVVVAWCRPTQDTGDGGWTAGLRFEGDPPVKTRMLLEHVALFDVEPRDGGGVTVTLHGDFTEITRFEALTARLADETDLEFDTASVRYLSSAGVRSWCQFLAGLAGKNYVFRHCSIAFASQAAMVPMVLGDGAVISLEAPYVCESCDHEDMRLLDVSAIARDGGPLPPRLTCLSCGGELTFDDVPERYFAFLAED